MEQVSLTAINATEKLLPTSGATSAEISKLKSSAQVFGISKTQLEEEFIGYKAEKLLKKVDFLIEDNTSEVKLREKICDAKRQKMGSVTVLPSRVEMATRTANGSGLKVNVLCNYPFGEELTKVKLLSVKTCQKLKVFSISTPLSPLMLGYFRINNTKKELKKMLKLAKNKKLKVIIDLREYTQASLNVIVRLLTEVGITYLQAKVDDGELAKFKALVQMCQDKIKVEAMGEVSLKTCATLFNLGASKVLATNASSLSFDLREELKKS